jgi:hypothetical protein
MRLWDFLVSKDDVTSGSSTRLAVGHTTFARGSPHIERHLAFRDYLRSDPLKAAAFPMARITSGEAVSWDEYMDAKDPFIAAPKKPLWFGIAWMQRMVSVAKLSSWSQNPKNSALADRIGVTPMTRPVFAGARNFAAGPMLSKKSVALCRPATIEWRTMASWIYLARLMLALNQYCSEHPLKSFFDSIGQ